MAASQAVVRRRARTLAVQALYLREIGDASEHAAVRTAARLAGREDPAGETPETEYADWLVSEVGRRREEIDGRLSASGSRWRVDRMSPLDLQVLRVAVAELLADVPVPVVIDEAVELAREFGGESSPAFVNGVLDAVARDLAGTPVAGATRGGKG